MLGRERDAGGAGRDSNEVLGGVQALFRTGEQLPLRPGRDRPGEGLSSSGRGSFPGECVCESDAVAFGDEDGWSSRSTRPVAMVRSMSWSNPLGWRLLLMARLRFS